MREFDAFHRPAKDKTLGRKIEWSLVEIDDVRMFVDQVGIAVFRITGTNRCLHAAVGKRFPLAQFFVQPQIDGGGGPSFERWRRIDDHGASNQSRLYFSIRKY